MCVFMNVHYISVESGMQHVAAVSINSFVSSELFFGEEGGEKESLWTTNPGCAGCR